MRMVEKAFIFKEWIQQIHKSMIWQVDPKMVSSDICRYSLPLFWHAWSSKVENNRASDQYSHPYSSLQLNPIFFWRIKLWLGQNWSPKVNEYMSDETNNVPHQFEGHWLNYSLKIIHYQFHLLVIWSFAAGYLYHDH